MSEPVDAVPERGDAGAAVDLKPLAPGLYLVATPIGNLEDITLRALRVLRSADRIACEDTRQTAKLLQHFGIKKPTVSYHLHNERDRAEELLAALVQGERVALVSDAGMPAIADPGELLVREAVAKGIAVYPVPGANAALSALIASGLPSERFSFHGFLPAKEGPRRTALEGLRREMEAEDADSPRTHLFYEAPHRILASLTEVVAVFGSEQPVVLARELTKLHEEFLRDTVAAVLQTLEQRPVIRGELVLLLAGRPTPDVAGSTGKPGAGSLATEVAALIAGGASEKEALKQVAKARGLGKSEAYREWQRHKR